MDADLKARKQVSLEQLKCLLDYLSEHQDLAKGLTRGRRGKLHSVKLWNACAKNLNAIGDGAVKDGKGWSKYWCDWKYRVRRRALELKAARDANKPPPDGVAGLSQMEETIMEIIGESVVAGAVIKTDPLAPLAPLAEALSDAESFAGDNKEDAPNNYDDEMSKGKRRYSSQEFSDERPSCTSKRKKRATKAEDYSGEDEDAAELIRLEKEKIEYSKRFLDTTREISGHLGKLVDIMTQIKDVLMNNRID